MTMPRVLGAEPVDGQRLDSKSIQYTVFFDTEKGAKTYSPGNLDDFSGFRSEATGPLC